MIRRHTAAVVSSIFLFASLSQANIIVAGLSFDDNAFADAVIDYSPTAVFQSYTTDPFSRFNVSAEQALTGSDLRSSTIELQSNEFVTVGFSDNLVYNGDGADLAIFEMFSTPEAGNVSVQLGGVAITQTAISLGYMDIGGVSNYVNVAYVDLSDYGFTAGQTTDYVRAYGNSSEYSAFGAIHSTSSSVPEPSTIAMFGFGLLSVAAACVNRRKR